MKIINGVVFGIIFALLGICIYGKRKNIRNGWYGFLQAHVYLLIILFAANTISFLLPFTQKDEKVYVEREGYAGEEKEVDILLKSGDDEETVSLVVSPRTFTAKELKEKMQEAFTYIDKHISGENKSLSCVDENLDVILNYEDYPFQMEVRPDDYSLIDEEGNIRNEKDWLLEEGYDEKDFQEGIKTGVTITLWYGEESQEKYYEIVIFPKEKQGVEKLFANTFDQIKKEEERTLFEEGFSIPAVMNGVTVTEEKGNQMLPVYVLFFGMLLCGLLIVREQENKKQMEKKRMDQLLRCYPWFVNEMVLMLGAGMQVKNIIAMLISDYETGGQRKEDDREPLITELRTARQNLNMGMSEQQVYYQLGRRLKLSCYIKLMTLLEQNVKRGTKGLAAFFEQEEAQALEERKSLAKRYGEEAGTKLLGPMMVLMLVIMLMIMIPAFLTFM